MRSAPLWAAVLICALFCLPRIIINGYAAPNSNSLFIRIPAPGLSAARVQQAVEPEVLEALATLPDEVRVDSIARPAELLVAVEAPAGGTSSDLHSRVQRRLFSAHSRLPYQAELPAMYTGSSTVPFLTCWVEFTDPVAARGQVRKLVEAEQLREEFRRAAEVRRVSIQGTADQEIAVRLKRQQLVRRNISPLYIAQYLRQCLFDFYSGSWPGRQQSLGIQLQSSLRSRQDLPNLTIPLPSRAAVPHLVQLSEIADIERNSRPAGHLVFGADIRLAVFTAPDQQMWRQLSLIRQLCKIMDTSTAIKSWHACGGHFFHAVHCAALIGALCCTGLLLALYLRGNARQYVLAWALLGLWQVVLQLPITYSSCTGFAAATPAVVGIHFLQSECGSRQIGRLCLQTAGALIVPAALTAVMLEFDGWQAAGGSIRLLLCAAVAAAGTLRRDAPPVQAPTVMAPAVQLPASKSRLPFLRSLILLLGCGGLLQPLLWLPLPCTFTAELDSELVSTEQRADCRRILAAVQQLYPKAHVCAVRPTLHEFSRARTVREYWSSCAHPDRLQVELLLSPLNYMLRRKALSVPRRLPSAAPPMVSGPLDSVSLEFKPQISSGKGLRRRDLYAQIDLAVKGSTVGTVPARTGPQGRLPVRLYYGSIHSQDELRALPIFVSDTDPLRLEMLCRLIPSSPDRQQ